MKSYKHQINSKHNGIRLAAVVSSAIMLAPVAMGTVSTFADTTSPINTQAVSDAATASALVAALYSDANNLQTLKSSTAFSKLSYVDQLTVSSAYSNAQTQINLAKAQLAAGTASSGIVSSLTQADQLVQTALAKFSTTSTPTTNSTASALTTLRTQLTNFTNAYYKLTYAQQNSTNGKYLLSALQTATGMVNSGSVSEMQASSIINNMNDYLKAITGANLATTSNQQAAIDASNAAKKEYSTVPIFLQDSDQYQRLGDLIDATADQINNKTTPAVELATDVVNLNAATAAMKDLVKASVVYSGVGTIRYPKNYGIQVWTIGGKMVKNSNGTAKKLKGGTKWKVFGPILNINGSKMYNLGGDQFIDANYVSFAAKK
ncbi:SLAP domain-containing protein [Lacticaseibacillus zhaodongensis]|uniref:SLAP domain-containing protein n=1 Tax=Lacticaseibacillus zhaodongensis TaxID=2668065 RepID=UPI0012D2C28F|nr:SLAP domain-containing protein [Lacticaseibacillus zhaodongensis]